MHILTTVWLFCPFVEIQQQIVDGGMNWRSLNMGGESRRKCFHFIWRLTSIRWGRERPNVKQRRTGWHLIDDDLWTHGCNTTCMHTLSHCTRVTSSSSSSFSLFFFSVSFAMLADKAPASVRHISFLCFPFFFFSLTARPRCILEFQLWWGHVKMLCNTCNICHGWSASL